MTTIKNAILDWNEAGTPVSDQFDDVYFSNVNGLEETRYVFLKQNHLPERWTDFDQRRFVIAETGFGTGLNFLAAWHQFEHFRHQNPDAKLKELHFISFEKFPVSKADLVKAHQAWPELAKYAEQLHEHYPIAVPDCHRIILADGSITLDLWFGDIKDCMPSVPTNQDGIVDAWFLDGFAPSKNPEMWNQNLFNGMAKLAKQDCSCATFTAAGFVRRGLIEAGFDMKKVKGFGTKREMIAGSLSTKKSHTNIKPWFYRSSPNHVDDVAIIGGGVASASLAACLAKRGVRVSLYCEDDRAAQGASGNRQGAVYPLINRSHTGASRVFAPAFLFARQFVNQAALYLDFDYDWCGVTQLGWDEKAQTKLDNMMEAGLDAELLHALTPEQTNEKLGLDVDVASVHYPLGGWLSPAQLTQGLVADLTNKKQLTAHFNHSITEISQLNDGWQLSGTNQQGETIHHQHQCVVVANGHQFTRFEQTQPIPATAVKGQVSHIPTTETLKHLKTVLCYDGYMTPQNPNNQHHCIGASYDKDNIDQEFDLDAHADNSAKLTKCLPNQAWTKEVDVSGNLARQGVRCVTRDHLPFVGQVANFDKLRNAYWDLASLAEEEAVPVPSYDNLYCFVGLGSRGLSSAPLMAETLASQICGDPLPMSTESLEKIHPAKMWVRKLRKGKALVERKA
ncbi:bifunctional tRNA (5-methylaminomethyl-2-thiouridine)(34)-methyltransferase MnmD/FAD-dependent 5-carboxymethylaminomethyl-2-thiouridine(34) oxidoreductase MnmC [Vibrio tapetis subsp. quintayensis]|uniref:bifunctional tRNA (5-methylaminomethyl-2-thiouridine)(34)-methyltransferase MnmD/FAD-dependent 5-carboxymethylaminomethyl-2-thiouridine(34) oxidoreductase MnmC n=1 Tax=Vibrio tapetis TaxID=52443 RepID=UPI0025B5C901|nr:bifunctional tRNA (5-methylaminomethyl-2-thiouridine)(34)-methyltransferase MnmD/FAD-dependent 5-carboxymethylaminomethyl-2-thiouridine(34) oxidoreductase MnmC [Vibrio tapetis]MDN3680566.1 bifunctional tRNA (5-methylaminomethyl-2-thiouridine)(34)-methyltransferase MnmD/FAD-dependent 5-carboxymethylaminomethyl-2-thiouridine(34) oxidoreductase MnmC [Vibrio tapetis subsp. quintayensis]